MICKYCTNKVTQDSRLDHLCTCTECAEIDEIGNAQQIKLGKGGNAGARKTNTQK